MSSLLGITSKEKPFITGFIDNISGRVVERREVSYEGALRYLKDLPRTYGEVNYAFFSIGSPIRKYCPLPKINGLRNLNFALQWIDEQVGHVQQIPRDSTPIFDMTLRARNNKKWFHAKLRTDIDILAGFSNHEAAIDIFEF